MIWLPYASYPACVVSLRTEELQETHDGLMDVAKSYSPSSGWRAPEDGFLYQFHSMFYEHQDSFYTLGLYVCAELRHRLVSGVTLRHQKTWAKYWEKNRKFRKFIHHPTWPEGFHQSMRESLVQRDWDHYSLMFKASDEPFGEVTIDWPAH